ncbi:THO2 plays a role in transcriptional elongation [Neocucurbitaria cava]|uniref:THO2 plays a role in transcriptional elongation n=1 Tax=Neocucurbitaria cava TaxID=798079 RepID=A0A9W8Y556_9PLEO|nr:THO2 plays a role in transcriptional elongation [Neocucurbitaria cava]
MPVTSTQASDRDSAKSVSTLPEPRESTPSKQELGEFKPAIKPGPPMHASSVPPRPDSRSTAQPMPGSRVSHALPTRPDAQPSRTRQPDRPSMDRPADHVTHGRYDNRGPPTEYGRLDRPGEALRQRESSPGRRARPLPGGRTPERLPPATEHREWMGRDTREYDDRGMRAPPRDARGPHTRGPSNWDPRDARDPRDLRDPRDPRDPRDQRERPDSRGHGERPQTLSQPPTPTAPSGPAASHPVDQANEAHLHKTLLYVVVVQLGLTVPWIHLRKRQVPCRHHRTLQRPILAWRVSIQGILEWRCRRTGWKALHQKKDDPSPAATGTADAASGQGTSGPLIEVKGGLMSEMVAMARPSDKASVKVTQNKSEDQTVIAVVVISEEPIERVVDESVNEKANSQCAIQIALVVIHGKAADVSVAHATTVDYPAAMSAIDEAEKV